MIMKMLIASTLAISASPPAASAEGVACVVEQTSRADRLAIADGALGTGASRERAVEAEGRFSEHLAACAERFGWGETEILRISALGVTALVREVAEARLADAGIEGAALDRWFEGQSDEFRTTAFHTMAEDEAAATIMTLEEGVVPTGLLDTHAGLIGGYLAMLVLAVRVERGLPVQ